MSKMYQTNLGNRHPVFGFRFTLYVEYNGVEYRCYYFYKGNNRNKPRSVPGAITWNEGLEGCCGSGRDPIDALEQGIDFVLHDTLRRGTTGRNGERAIRVKLMKVYRNISGSSGESRDEQASRERYRQQEMGGKRYQY